MEKNKDNNYELGQVNMLQFCVKWVTENINAGAAIGMLEALHVQYGKEHKDIRTI